MGNIEEFTIGGGMQHGVDRCRGIVGHFSGGWNRPGRYGFMYLGFYGRLRFLPGNILMAEKDGENRSQVDESDKRYDNRFGYKMLHLHFQGTLVVSVQITPKSTYNEDMVINTRRFSTKSPFSKIFGTVSSNFRGKS